MWSKLKICPNIWDVCADWSANILNLQKKLEDYGRFSAKKPSPTFFLKGSGIALPAKSIKKSSSTLPKKMWKCLFCWAYGQVEKLRLIRHRFLHLLLTGAEMGSRVVIFNDLNLVGNIQGLWNMTNQPPRNFMRSEKFFGKSWPPWPQNDHTKLLLVNDPLKMGNWMIWNDPWGMVQKHDQNTNPVRLVLFFLGVRCVYIYISYIHPKADFFNKVRISHKGAIWEIWCFLVKTPHRSTWETLLVLVSHIRNHVQKALKKSGS